ncbi:sulfurtransferase-like selenium metabolism protein YedF [Arcobacter sp. FWKO B]|uniref:sulfurtransferase-like selenium metabolism protein YedF n=1 Tax=Arcobacter sp. FWKO B TaxID=2593672 RepID=UPI0018A390B4|nr:sulfurtransferase-like selenium metabolism protein YedF [Arcobacter sp. FWKO B]QOG11797.1 sulfurtransferase-like selenium metabolism protein YedF [Arcobacter sp. FWKO B]
MKTYDARGLSCPQPVLITKNALNCEKEDFIVVCGSNNSKENISRFLSKMEAEFSLEEKDDGFYFSIKSSSSKDLAPNEEVNCQIQTDKKTIIFTSDTIGKDEVLGKKLSMGFIKTLPKVSPLPKNIFFVNSAVKLTTSQDDHELIDALKILINEGVKIYSCGLCLEHYNLSDKLQVGEVGNALDTLQGLLDSKLTITLG